MNKLLTKIVGLSLGLSMAIGVGVAASYSEKDAVRADATTVGTSYTVSSTAATSITNNGLYVLKESTNGFAGTIASNWAETTTTQSDYFILKAVVTDSTFTLKDYDGTKGSIYCSAAKKIAWSTNNATSFSLMTGKKTTTISNAIGNSTIGTLQYNSSGFRPYTSATGNDAQLFAVTAASTPTLAVASSLDVDINSTGTLAVTYSHVSSGVSITASSTNTSVATVTSSVTTTGTSGTANFTVTPAATGTTTIKFNTTGATEVSTTVSVFEQKEFTKIISAAKVVSGGHYLIAKTGSTTVMSTTQNNNNRGVTSVSGTDPYTTLTTSDATPAILTIEAGTGDNSGYYTMYDPVNEGYLYAPTGGNYLRTGTDLTSYYYWSISFEDNHAVIANKGKDGYTIRNNGSLFAAYASGQTAVDLYLLTSEVPVDVALTSITASNASVEAGSIIELSGTYLPTNATEAIIVKTLDSNYATAGSVSMSNGTFTVEITGVSATAGTTLTFEGEDGNGTTSVTLVVTSYVATHTLVTSSSSLANGSKVIIACTDADYNYSAEKSTGGNNLNGTITGFAADKSSLAAAETSQEFVVWCVDSTNGYYVFSDGGYFLASPTSKNNYLLRTEVLSEACYFTITNDASGVVIQNSYGMNHGWKDVSTAYTLEFNSSTSKFSLYGTSQKAASLYLSMESMDPIQGFIDAFMHFGNVPHNPLDPDTGNCKADKKGYFNAALAAYNQLTPEQQEDFCTEATYANAYERLSDWASANGYSFNGYALSQDAAHSLNSLFGIDTNTSIIVIVAITTISLTSVGAFFALRKRKENI